MDNDVFISLYKLIQRRSRLAAKEKIYDFNSRFRKAFESLSKIISSLSNFITLKEFEEFLIAPKRVPLSFLNHQDELTKFSKIMEDLRQLGFDGYDILKIINFLMNFLKNDEHGTKLEALMQLLEQLFII